MSELDKRRRLVDKFLILKGYLLDRQNENYYIRPFIINKQTKTGGLA